MDKAYEKNISLIWVDQTAYTSEQPVSSLYFYSMISEPRAHFSITWVKPFRVLLLHFTGHYRPLGRGKSRSTVEVGPSHAFAPSFVRNMRIVAIFLLQA